ncbi:MAG: DeoR/GlpR family DNA-binding transcription regulator [Verrucomicrobiota bacterium JB022]|nr:DeoR/GlpR family DNA-binding transcription regulator [Verrucomicrobiota bacterium JB022]
MRQPQQVIDQRRRELAEAIRRERFIPVAEVCRRFGISEATARRDLRFLEKHEQIKRHFGGALMDFDRDFDSFQQRVRKREPEKRRIADRCAEFVEDGMTCFLDAGSAIYYVASALCRRDFESLAVVTNNIAVAELLGEEPGIHTILSGGRYFGRQSALLGREAKAHLKDYQFDLCLLGAEAMNERGIWNSDAEIVELQQAVIEQSKRALFALDASKWNRTAGEFLCPWLSLDYLVTDLPHAEFAEGGGGLPAERYLAV